MKTLIFSVLLFIGFGFSAEGQMLYIDACRECDSHLLKLVEHDQLGCLDGSNILLGYQPDDYFGLRPDEDPSPAAIQAALRTYSNNNQKIDFSEIEVLSVKHDPLHGYLILCNNKGKQGYIGLKIMEPYERDPWKKDPAVHGLKLIISTCENAALDGVLDREDGYECEEGPMKIKLSEIKVPFKLEGRYDLSFSKAQCIIDNTEFMNGDLYKMVSPSSHVHKFYTKFEGVKLFYMVVLDY